MAATIATGITSANVEPNNAVTLGVADVMNACRNC